jgi:hypothetical protein
MKHLVLLILAAASLAACAPGKFGNGGPPDPGNPPRPVGDPRR